MFRSNPNLQKQLNSQHVACSAISKRVINYNSWDLKVFKQKSLKNLFEKAKSWYTHQNKPKCMDFLQRRLRQNSTSMMSFCVQQENAGCGLPRSSFGVRDNVWGVERAGVNILFCISKMLNKSIIQCSWNGLTISAQLFYQYAWMIFEWTC